MYIPHALLVKYSLFHKKYELIKGFIKFNHFKLVFKINFKTKKNMF